MPAILGRFSETQNEIFGTTFPANGPRLAGNVVFDAHTAVLMRENGVRMIYTNDGDFNRFPFIDVLGPVTGKRRTAR